MAAEVTRIVGSCCQFITIYMILSTDFMLLSMLIAFTIQRVSLIQKPDTKVLKMQNNTQISHYKFIETTLYSQFSPETAWSRSDKRYDVAVG